MKKITSILATGLLALVIQLGFAVPASAQTDLKTVKCGDNQVAIGVAINGQNCVDKGTTLETNVIFLWLTSIIRFLTVGVGLAAVGGVLYGGFLYLTARGNAGQTQKGVIAIINALIGIVMYALSFAIINFLIPGGVLR